MTTRTSFAAAAILLQIIVIVVPTVSGFSPPMGLGAVFFKPAGSKTLPSLGEDDALIEAADFFTDAFWACKIADGPKELQPRQRKSLLNSQMLEFRKRYGMKFGDRRAELLISRNGKNDIMGTCGIEVDKILDGGLQGSVLTKAPLMSNVAVGKKFRRKGIAEDMVMAAEDLARKQWGYEEVYLYVEKRNKAAIRLYEKIGYRKMWEDDGARTMVPMSSGGLENAPTTLVCMKKQLSRGILGRLLPF